MSKSKVFLWLCVFSFTFFGACKTAVNREQRKADEQRKAKQRKEQRIYNKGFKAHLNRQDKGTKKMIKKNLKLQKKQYKENRPKGKVPNTCPNTKGDQSNVKK